MARKNWLHVVQHEDGWAIRREGSTRASRVFDTQAEANANASRVARAEQGEVLIHGRDGKIRERNSYGNDDFPPQG